MPQFTASFVVLSTYGFEDKRKLSMNPAAGKRELNQHIKEMTAHGWELVSTSSCGPIGDLVYLFWRHDAPKPGGD